MGLNKRSVAALAVASALITSIGLSSFAPISRTWAAEEDHASKQLANIPLTETSCALAQETINKVASKGNITITEDCNTNLTIPSGKYIILGLYTIPKDESQGISVHTLTADGGDIITVERGATLVLDKAAAIRNASNNSILNNEGVVYMKNCYIRAEDSASTFINSGELNIVDWNRIDDIEIRNSDGGKIRLAGGEFTNAVSDIEQYVVDGAIFDKSTNKVVAVDEEPLSDFYQSLANMTILYLGETKSIRVDHREYFEAYGVKLSSTDNAIFEVDESNSDIWTLKPHMVGKADLIMSTVFGVYKQLEVTVEYNPLAAQGVSCAEAQNAINSIDESGSVTIAESCSADLVIPSGKHVNLQVGLYDKYGDEITLTNEKGNTVTVEEGASAWITGHYINSTPGKAIINNHGTVDFEGELDATNGAYSVANSGDLSIMGATSTGTAFQNSGALSVLGGTYSNVTSEGLQDTGKLQIFGGTFDDIEAIKPYVVAGTSIVNSNAVSVKEQLIELLNWYANFVGTFMDKELPVGYSVSVKSEYPEYMDAIRATFFSSDSSVLEVTGSNHEGWTFTVVGTGEASLNYSHYALGARADIKGYEVTVGNTGEAESFVSDSMIKKILSQYHDEVQQAIEDGATITLDLNVDEIKGAIDDGQAAEIAKVIGDDKVAAYYDTTLVLNGDGKELAKVTDLGDTEEDTVIVRLPADVLKALEGPEEGYKRVYYVVRYHDGVAEKITNIEIKDDEIVFRNSKFSTFAVAYSDVKISNDPEEDDPSKDPSGGEGEDDPSGNDPKDPEEDDPSGNDPKDPSEDDPDKPSDDNPEDSNKPSQDNPTGDGQSSNKPSTGANSSSTPTTPDTGMLAHASDAAGMTIIGVLLSASIASVITLGVEIKKWRNIKSS